MSEVSSPKRQRQCNYTCLGSLGSLTTNRIISFLVQNYSAMRSGDFTNIQFSYLFVGESANLHGGFSDKKKYISKYIKISNIGAMLRLFFQPALPTKWFGLMELDLPTPVS
jgi:hypothetical protein